MGISVQRARLSLAVGTAILLVACGGDDAPQTANNKPGVTPDNSNPPPSSPPATGSPSDPIDEPTDPIAGPPSDPSGQPNAKNSPPQISGTPQAMVLPESVYVFEPTAKDADGDILHFSVTNLPPWAGFEKATGRIQGQPGPGHVGTYDGIRIAVTDGADDAELNPFSITVTSAAAGAVELSWQAPSENVDGTALTDLAGYRIYWGTSPDGLSNSVTVDNPGIVTYVLEDLVPATYYFIATAVNNEGTESDPSDITSLTIS